MLIKNNEIIKINKIKSLWKGKSYRRKNLPNSIRYIREVLKSKSIICSNITDDGRTNSCIDEELVINILKQDSLLKERIYKPLARHWFDISVYDYKYGWLPINIKSTTTLTADNTGNLAMCVQALTETQLNLNEFYQNGLMSKVLISNLKEKKINKYLKKDYYFVVINKIKTDEIIINSFKGLSELTPNINNLPFQVKWCLNKEFKYQNIDIVLKKFINCIKKPKPSWRENFLNEIRMIN